MNHHYFCEVCDNTYDELLVRPIFVNKIDIKFNNTTQWNGVCCNCWKVIDEEEKEEYREFMNSNKIASIIIIDDIPVPFFYEILE